MRADGTFIAVEVDDAAAADTELARKLTEACPVDIFAQRENGTLELVEGNLDECVLCRLCLDAAGHTAGTAGSGAVKIIKLYDDSAVLA
jgi:ferredoxin-like protein FixX